MADKNPKDPLNILSNDDGDLKDPLNIRNKEIVGVAGPKNKGGGVAASGASQSMNSSVLPRISFTQDLENLLNVMQEDNSYIAFELLGLLENDSKYHNGLKITLVDISEKDFCFDVVIDNRSHPMKIGRFIRYFIGNEHLVAQQEIYKFSETYNKLKNNEPSVEEEYDPIIVPPYVYNPKDVRSTFLGLVTKTYPHGHEEEVLKFLPKLEKDSVGNYYLKIGQSETMFTCHLDTADRNQEDTVLYDAEESGEAFIITDGNTILGADDKAGVTIILYMIAHNIPGLYYFFIGEERGGIGSGKLSYIFSHVAHLKGIKRCVSFDRRGYHSVITEQMGRVCCSNQFGTALCKEFNKSGLVKLSLDPTGIYTDSASFIEDIPECTNVSVGYMHEHTGDEYQNIDFLEKICKSAIKVDWESLPTVRKIGIDPDIVARHKKLLDDIKGSAFELEVKLYGRDGRVYLKIDMDETDIDTIHNDLVAISGCFRKHKMSDPDITFSDTNIKIELK